MAEMKIGYAVYGVGRLEIHCIGILRHSNHIPYIYSCDDGIGPLACSLNIDDGPIAGEYWPKLNYCLFQAMICYVLSREIRLPMGDTLSRERLTGYCCDQKRFREAVLYQEGC